MHGEGTFYSRSGIKVYTGTFVRNLPQGQGRLFHKDGETRYYDGQWERGRWDGAGNHYNRNGILRYDGEFGQGPPNQNMFGGWGGFVPPWAGGNTPVETAPTGWGPANLPANADVGMQGSALWALIEGVRNEHRHAVRAQWARTYDGEWK